MLFLFQDSNCFPNDFENTAIVFMLIKTIKNV